MGEVYKAKDTRLDRLVAVKVCHDQVSDRFAREARAVAALNHPNILALFDTGDNYFVTELIDGDSLRNSHLTPRRAIEVAIQIADGLAAAHAVGIAHRDLKPDNVMLTKDGRAKILDFGLARHHAPNEPSDATRTLPGTIMGTVGYMSPEQVRGEEADHRSDIFSFGAMLYEMLAHKRAFTAPTIPEVLTAILRQDPPDVDLPPQWRELLRHCLEKEPAARFQSAKDLAFALRSLLIPAAAQTPATATPARAWPLYALAALLPIASALAWFAKPKAPLDLANYRITPFASESVAEVDPAWSPDGKMIAYTLTKDRNSQIFTRRLDSPIPDQITHEDASCQYPVWSKSGDRIYFTKAGAIWSIAAIGGAARKELDAYTLAAIAPDGVTMAAYRRNELVFGKVGGTTWTPFKKAPFDQNFITGFLRFSPDGTHLVLQAAPVNSAFPGEIWLVPVPPATGEPRKIPLSPQLGLRGFSWMPDGRHFVTAIMRGGIERSQLYLADSQTGALRRLTAGLNDLYRPAVSPDGKRIAFVQDAGDTDLVQISTDGTQITPVLTTSLDEDSPVWLANGREFAYLGGANGIREPWIRNLEDGRARPLLDRAAALLPPGRLSALALSPDGDRLTLTASAADHAVWALRIRGGAPARIDPGNPDHHFGAWSPDGNWIATSRVLPKSQLVKVPAGGGTPIIIATPEAQRGGPTDVAWSPTGEWIAWAAATLTLYSPDGKQQKKLANLRRGIEFSRDGKTLYAIYYSVPERAHIIEAFDVATGNSRIAGRFTLPAGSSVSDFRIHPDGKRFLATLTRNNEDIALLDGF
jgi:Tol biopolymer transport system component